MSNQFDDLPPVLSVPEAAALLRIGRDKMYDCIRRGEIPSLRFGKRIVVPVPGLMRLLNGEMEQPPPNQPMPPPSIMAMKQSAVSNLRERLRRSRPQE